MSATDWEQSKENAAPLRRGRKVETLGRKAFGISNRDKNDRLIEKFEQLVRPSEDPNVTETEDDPLEHWLSYIKFYQEAFPSDTHEQFLLMERCTRALLKMRQYANDDRFIAVCAKYADKTKDPMAVFKYLHQEKIGTENALLWIAWAYVAEKENDFQFAEKIFKKGISKNAQPMQLLKTRHRQFERRMSRNWLNSSQQSDQLEDEDDDTAPGRQVLGGVTRGGASRTRRGASMMRQSDRNRTFVNRQSRRPTHQTRNANANTNSGNEFSVFVDEENADDGYNLDQSNGRGRVIETQAERRKENTIEAERWNQRGGLRRNQETHQRSHSKGPPPAFSVFVDEECAAQHEAEQASKTAESNFHRRCRDDRTFRERDGEGMAEKLARDPLRYVKDRTRLESDTTIYSKGKSETENKAAASGRKLRNERKNKKGAGFDMRLLRNAQGEEQSFEEARANAKCFTLLPSSANFNLLHTECNDQSSQMDLDESSDEMSMGDFPEELAADTSNTNHSVDARNDSAASKKSIFQATSFDGSLNRTAISTASSTLDEVGAVGIPTRKEEETINTKFAMRELSMMFSSPAVGADDMARKTERAMLNRSTSANDSYDHIMNIMDHQQMNNSIFNIDEDENDENDGECNDEARSNSTPGFHGMALRELEGDQDAANSLSCREQQRRGIPGQLSQENPLAQGETELHSDAGFKIFEDARVGDDQSIAAKSSFTIFQDEPDVAKTTLSNSVAKQSFTIFEENGEHSISKLPATKASFAIFQDEPERKHPSVAASKSAFTIHEDEVGSRSDSRQMNSQSSNLKESGFSIFEDGKRNSPNNHVKDSPQSCTASDNGETATLSLFEGAIEMLGGNNVSDHSRSSEASGTKGEKRPSSGDTASISLFNEAFAEFGIDTSEKNHAAQIQSSTRKHKFDIFVDESAEDSNSASRGRTKKKSRNSDRKRPGKEQCVHQKVDLSTVPCYLEIHEHESRQALQHCQQSSVVPRSDVSLADLLSTPGHSFDLPHLLLPRLLRRKETIPSKAQLSIGGKYSGKICNELGRGAYGVVVLMKQHKSEEVMAVKSQAPTSCLALEYQILRQLHERIGRNQNSYPFPRPLSFVSLADGGIMSMTAGSTSGLNIVDLSNIYRIKLGETVPELLALHYTSRMLKHIEMLHSQGRLLHCDVKPDNFVLCRLDCKENNYREFEYSDLFLVDFGRAIDLERRSDLLSDAQNTLFCGNASCAEARCLSMRRGMPWSYDIDTFGILSAAHVLLYGKHMEIRKSRDSKWRIQVQFRRYWNKDLWTEIFDSLFYVDKETGLALGSRPHSLSALRRKIDDSLKGEEAKIIALLKRQAALLPKRRE